jgi:hypothetical protein
MDFACRMSDGMLVGRPGSCWLDPEHEPWIVGDHLSGGDAGHGHACITQDSLVPQTGSGQGQGQCEITDIQVQGDTVTWSITCDSQGGVMTGTGESTYHGDTFEGTSEMHMQGMDITTTMSGKRIGDCQ